MLELKNVSFSFGEKVIFKDFSMTIPDGVSYALMAQSGRGKTTAFNLISGLLKPDSGEIIRQGRISYAFQDNRLIPDLTVSENLTAVLKNSPGSKHIAELILSEMSLGGAANMFPAELSGGMAKRVTVARALIYPSDIVLLDEPFAGLDSDTKQIVADVIRKYTAGKTVVSIIHDEADANLLGAEIRYIDIANNYQMNTQN